ncbi:MAG TPA: hypothetical protein PLD25_10735 [Chloroflexota bacterium]|nr:hypothetical protein [Chloroflexota bacterium]
MEGKHKFALCLNNEGYEASLEVGKMYRVVGDGTAVQHGYLRIIDESGEDYAYATHRFYLVVLPREVENALMVTAQT